MPTEWNISPAMLMVAVAAANVLLITAVVVVVRLGWTGRAILLLTFLAAAGVFVLGAVKLLDRSERHGGIGADRDRVDGVPGAWLGTVPRSRGSPKERRMTQRGSGGQ